MGGNHDKFGDSIIRFVQCWSVPTFSNAVQQIENCSLTAYPMCNTVTLLRSIYRFLMARKVEK